MRVQQTVNRSNGSRLARAVAVVQGGSYVYFGAWALLRRDDYIARHELQGTSHWVLNAHAGWMLLVGSELLSAGSSGRVHGGTMRLGLASATALALNDAALLRGIAPIYRSDLAWETVLAFAWLAAIGRGQFGQHPVSKTEA